MIFLSSKNYWDCSTKKKQTFSKDLISNIIWNFLQVESFIWDVKIKTFEFLSSIVLTNYKTLSCVVSVIQISEWILSILMSLADKSSEKTPSKLSLSDSEKKYFLFWIIDSKHPFYNFINSQVVPSTCCPLYHYCFKKV